MLDPLIQFCTSTAGLFWLVLGSDASIAVAYFAIPVTMAVVLRERGEDIPYPWLWTLFVLFIVACGLTHSAHVLSAATGVEYLRLQAAMNVFCAVTSVGTAVAFTFILPQIKLLPSPAQQRAMLEKLVSERTGEKDQLIREINHRVGNQLQIISSLLSLESRATESKEALDILSRLMTHLDKMAHEHRERSKVDYLRYGVSKPDGTIAPNADNASKPDIQSTPLTA